MSNSRENGCTGLDCICISRRKFLKLTAGVAGFSIFGVPDFAGATPDHKLSQQELDNWFKSLSDSTSSGVLRYTPRQNPMAAVPMGGIGCGNVYLGVDGSLKDWLIFNNLNPIQVPDTFFAVKAQGVARVLQTTKADHPTGQVIPVQDCELTGEYPFAEIRYLDDKLPVEIKLEAFTPMIPLDSRNSAFPAVVFLFKVKNLSDKKTDISMLFCAQNMAGWNLPGDKKNSYVKKGSLTGVRMSAVEGVTARMNKKMRLVHNSPSMKLTYIEMPADAEIIKSESPFPAAEILKISSDNPLSIWLDNPKIPNIEDVRNIYSAVSDGATLVVTGAASMLTDYLYSLNDEQPVKRPDILFENFESGRYENWKIEGDAFGDVPAKGKHENQSPVTGFNGNYLVNSFTKGDAPQGRMVSKKFIVSRRFIQFLIGGGAHPGKCCINLVVDGWVARSQTGRNEEQLRSHIWDVSDLEGLTAHFEIIDYESGPWGHVNVDEIVFSDSPAHGMDKQVAQKLESLLPISFSGIVNLREPVKVESGSLPGLNLPVKLAMRSRFTELSLPSGCEAMTLGDTDAPILFKRPVGKGMVHLLAAPAVGNIHEKPEEDRAQALALVASLCGGSYCPGKGNHPKDITFGEMMISTDYPEATALTDIKRADQAFSFLMNSAKRSWPVSSEIHSPVSESLVGAVEVQTNLEPSEEKIIPFYLTWRFPNYHFWTGWVGNRYASFWKDSVEVAAEISRNRKKLHQLTEKYRRCMYDSTLPYWLIDCLTSQSSTIRSEVCIWTDEDAFAGYEGSGGCCPMNCSHVWGYEQTLSRLYPDLERRMRLADLKYQQNDDGGINNRIVLPLAEKPTGEFPFMDGHASGILKAYREHLNSPDMKFLEEYWQNIRKAVDYLVSLDGQSPDGILDHQQFNTYDCQVTGPNSFIGTYYLAALRAGEEMAKLMGEQNTASRYRSIFESGRDNLVKLTWNGEYFIQKLDDYDKTPTQYGTGCLADQLIGQWWAHQLGLGYLLPEEYVKTALKSIYKYNWLTDFSDWKHNQRVFADGHDKGLLNCTWPKGGRPPSPILYCDEVWTGVEYQVAAHMAYEGMLDECLAIVAGARERYDGRKRNPWDEIECGGHYARAMANWSILLALSGFRYNGPKGQLAFNPIFRPENFRSFFSTAEGWGTYSQVRLQNSQVSELNLDYGKLRLSHFSVPLPAGAKVTRLSANIGRQIYNAGISDGSVVVKLPNLDIKSGQKLTVKAELS